MKIGILGGGQLGMMLVQAGEKLGLDFILFDPDIHACGGKVANIIHAPFTDTEALEKFTKQVDVITYEFENIPLLTVDYLEKFKPVYPPRKALQFSQDRFVEKTFLQNLKVPVPKFAEVNSLHELESACNTIKLPAVLKTRRMGYDGKGQIVINSKSEIQKAWQEINNHSLILEEMIRFSKEISIIGVRDGKGEILFYPPIHNTHKEGILRLSRAPAEIDMAVFEAGKGYVKSVVETLDYVGVIAIEFFLTGDNLGYNLIANEIAPRVHNSGHWTIEGAETSQFENHIRAVSGRPLGSTECIGSSAMVNIIGKMPDISNLEVLSDIYPHIYGKAEREGRKLGHITIHGTNSNKVDELLTSISSYNS